MAVCIVCANCQYYNSESRTCSKHAPALVKIVDLVHNMMPERSAALTQWCGESCLKASDLKCPNKQ